ncbi:hypothetical protein [Tautonia marina]|uniref:hypothetical protein n=1 Tax=Tautonia marina TaxID=2653855 RepID=UPI0012605434|nr:hypothetical protein [Tautonia marina]
MTSEETHRRTRFLRGVPLLLADGQLWFVPSPATAQTMEGLAGGHVLETLAVDPIYLELLRAVSEAEDRSERLRSELALIIHLLEFNYALDIADAQRILEFEPNSPALLQAQRAFHELACDHVQGFRRRLAAIEPRVEPRRKRSWLDALKRSLVRLG